MIDEHHTVEPPPRGAAELAGALQS